MRSLRTIASEWHSGQWSDLYAFASSGHIASTLQSEIRKTYNRIPREQRHRRSVRELRTLFYAIGRIINERKNDVS